MNEYNIEFRFNGKTYKGKSKGVDKEHAIRNLRSKIVIKSIDKIDGEKSKLYNSLDKDVQESFDRILDYLGIKNKKK